MKRAGNSATEIVVFHQSDKVIKALKNEKKSDFLIRVNATAK
jgi:hypothetical protein